MNVHWKHRLASLAGSAALVLSFSSCSQAQQPSTPPSVAPSAAQTSAPSDDLGARIDALLKQSNDQLYVKGQFKEAVQSAQQGFQLSQDLGDKNRTLRALLYLGSALFYVGRSVDALDAMQKAAALARETGNKKGLSRALNNIAGIYGEMGRFEESLSYLRQTIELARELDDPAMQHTALLNVGALYVRLGDPDKAEAPLLESLRIGRELKHSDLVANPSKFATESALQALGEMEAARQHYQLALNYLEQVRQSRPDRSQSMLEVLEAMAVIQQRLGNPQKAEQLLNEAISIAEKSGSVSYWGAVADLGVSQEALGQLSEALASENSAMAAVRKGGGNPDYEWQIEQRIGHVNRSLGRNEEALTHYQNSIRGIDRLRASALNTEPGLASFSGRSRTVYAETADLLHQLNRDGEALEIAERGRARAFLELLAESRVGLLDELSVQQRGREDKILARITAIQQHLWEENVAQDEQKKFNGELSAAEDELAAFHLEMRQSNPHYASIQYPEPANVATIQARLLDDRTALVEFLLGDTRSLVWVITKNNLTTAILPARRDIEEQVTAYRKLLTVRASALTLHQSLTDANRLGRTLYSSLIQPVETALAGSHTLIIVPDGALNYLPFESLPLPLTSSQRNPAGSSTSFLVEKFAVVYGPSASSLVALQAINRPTAAPSRTLLAFGDPIVTPSSVTQTPMAVTRSTTQPAATSPIDDYAERGFSFTRLPYSRDEVLAISRLFPVTQRQVYLADQAREETVKSQKLDDFRFIHFATHGFIDESKPGRSGILLSRGPNSQEDGVLQIGEIMRLKLNADLVTLSACSTGLGKLINGEGILGLTRAFFYSGARNVTVSFWDVNDSATSALMKAYYANLKRGLPKSESLRQAKLTILHGKNSTWSQPYFWAPFVLIGEGK
jgi:CHAT domain-containing protein/Tfp pilus assembly protein PilF